MSPSDLSPLEAKAILATHLPQPPTELPVVSLVPSTDADPTARASFHSYLIHISTPAASYLVTLQISESLAAQFSAPSNLQAQYNLLCSLHAHVSSEPPPIPFPFPVPVALNTDVPRPYILARLLVPLTASVPLKQLTAVRDSLPLEGAASLDLILGV